MLKSILTYKFPLVLVLVLYIIHLNVKDFSNPNQKPIVGDAKAYYAYLPALFIYNDAEYSFVTEYESKHYNNLQSKDFLTTTENGKKVNKTFPGAAILYLPFFLIAHVLALLSNTDADGYSLIYQYLFDFGYWVYLLIGAIYYLKLFRLLKFKNKHIYLSLAILLVGTNIFFYTIVDQSVTHIFNFTLINSLLYHLLKYKESKEIKRLFISLAVLALIGITRPTNIIVLLLIPIFIFQKEYYITIFKELIRPKHLFFAFVVVSVIGCIPFLLWQWQSGNWVVYSYGDEGFDFTHPELLNFLFSYMKGWFTYTPVALLIIVIGLIYQFIQSKAKMLLIVMFYMVSIYIFSSWWCWYYGAGMSQRVMIDHYVLLGYLMLLILQKAPKIQKYVILTLIATLSVGNIIQTFQIQKGIYNMGSPSKEMYWDNFLSLTKKAKVYDKKRWELIDNINVDLNPEQPFIVKGNPIQNVEKYFLQTSKTRPYSASISVKLNSPTKKIVIGFSALAQIQSTNSRVVFTTNENTPQSKVIYLKEFLIQNKEIKMEYLLDFDVPFTQFEIYLWNGGTDEVVDYYDFSIESYKSKQITNQVLNE